MIFWRLVRGVLKFAFAIAVIMAVPAVVAVGAIEIACRPEPATGSIPTSRLGIAETGYQRDLAATYFAFPARYVAYSAEDFARFVATKPESAFSYIGQIDGFWRGFCAANLIAGAFPGNVWWTKVHLYVAGLSLSFEYAIKGVYENTIGRLTEWLRGPMPAAEDLYAHVVLDDYAAFLRQRPWHAYPFGEKLVGLWQMPFVSGSTVRNVERKVALSVEYGVKQVYATFAGLGPPPRPDDRIMFVIRGDGGAALALVADARVVQRLAGGLTLIEGRRGEGFTALVQRLGAANVEIVEIAGNQRVMLSAIASETAATAAIPRTARMFSLLIDSRPGFRRVGYDADVTALPAILAAFRQSGAELEYVYDY